MIRNLSSRRNFLKGTALATTGLMLAVQVPRTAGASRPKESTGAFAPNAFVRIDDRGITLIMPHTEFGQGIYTSSAMLVAEELDVDLDQIRVEPAPPDIDRFMDPILYDQATGGSTSTRTDWMRLREAGAVARLMLVTAAAARWKVDASACRTEKGIIHHDPSGRSVSYGDIAAEAAELPLPVEIPLKPAAQFKIIGSPVRRLDTPAKVDGSALYGIDVRVPGMKVATLASAPVKGGRIASLDRAAAKAVEGVIDIVRAGDFAVAVIAEHMWAAIKGIEALAIRWDSGANGRVSVETIVEAMEHTSNGAAVVVRKEKDAQAAIEAAPIKLSAVYESPFLSHSALEPLSCILHIRDDKADVWVGTQAPVRAQRAVADVTGLAIENVTLHNQLMGGAFGRRLEVDFIEIAALLVKDIRYPVKMVWTREEDMTHDYYRPYYYDRVAVGLDSEGKLLGRTHRVTGSSIFARWAPAGFINGVDPDAVDCAERTPYDEDVVHVDFARNEPDGVNTSWWRGVGPTHNLFVIESFIDEMAQATGKDPLDFRRGLLTRNPRALAVLELAAAKAGWSTSLPLGQGRGISLQFAFGTYLAHIVTVEVTARGDIRLLRSVIAVDCGSTVNPDTVRAQMEGGTIFGLSAALHNEITLTDGAVDQSNFDSYRMLRIDEAPKIEVHQIRNNEPPGGIGETATASAAGALANAIFSATGKRIRALPLAKALT